MTEADRAAIAEHVASLRIDQWAPLDSGETDLVRRALAPEPAQRTDPAEGARVA